MKIKIDIIKYFLNSNDILCLCSFTLLNKKIILLIFFYDFNSNFKQCHPKREIWVHFQQLLKNKVLILSFSQCYSTLFHYMSFITSWFVDIFTLYDVTDERR